MTRPPTNLEKIFKVINKVTKKSIQATSKVEGFFCELYYPKATTTNPTVPRVFDNDAELFSHEYSIVPNKKQKLIVIGLFGDTFRASDASFDNQNGDLPYVLTHKDQLIPVLTRIKVYRGANFHDMKVQEHYVYPSVVEGRIYVKNLLVPFN